MKKFFFECVVLISFFSCEKINVADENPDISKHGIYVLNEGVWNQNNSSISYFDFDSTENISDLATQKWGHPLGDTGNSFYEKNDTVFICVTSSNKIEIFQKSTGNLIRTFQFPQNTEPRFSVRVEDKLFVTSFKLGAVVKINLKNYQQEKIIPIGNYPEQIIDVNGKLVVAVTDLGIGNQIAVVNSKTEEKETSIRVGINPVNLFESENFILVHCVVFDKPESFIYRLNKNNFEVIDSVSIKKKNVQIGKYGPNQIYLIDEEKVELADSDLENSSTLFFVNKIHSKIIYSSLFDEKNEILWIASTDAYTVQGWLEGFKNGEKIFGAFQTGKNPGDLLVK